MTTKKPFNFAITFLPFVTIGLLTVATIGCTSQSGNSDKAKKEDGAEITRCEELRNFTVNSDKFGLPTAGASVTEAEIVNKPTRYCKVTGLIQAKNASDLPIRFQLNLPLNWNGKIIQFGGGGANGVVITGLENSVHLPSHAPSPIEQGYATFGGDSGHDINDKHWSDNEQANANYMGESIKRTHDAATEITKTFYSSKPQRSYFIGGSKGGHEALVAAQRYGMDYDGVVSFYPAASAFAMQMSWARMGYTAEKNSAARLSSANAQYIKEKSLEYCDSLDGVTDGLISNTASCLEKFSPSDLLCPATGQPEIGCLTAAQVVGLNNATSVLRFDLPLSGGVTHIGPYPVLLGASSYGIQFTAKTNVFGMIYRSVGEEIAKTISNGKVTSWYDFDYRAYPENVRAFSDKYDAADTELTEFLSHGGKMIIIQGTTDMLVPSDLTTQYWLRLNTRHGKATTDFARYYVQPGFGHGEGDFKLSVSSIDALDSWVEGHGAPSNLVARDENPQNNGRTRPLCEYPNWPKYKGRGDINEAENYSCVSH